MHVRSLTIVLRVCITALLLLACLLLLSTLTPSFLSVLALLRKPLLQTAAPRVRSNAGFRELWTFL